MKSYEKARLFLLGSSTFSFVIKISLKHLVPMLSSNTKSLVFELKFLV